MDIQNRQVTISDRATMLPIYSIIMNMTAVFTDLIFGKLADIGVSFAMATGALLCFAGCVIYAVGRSRTASRVNAAGIE